MELSARSYLTAGVALTAATAIAFTPVLAPTSAPTLELPRVSVSEVHLAAVINPADVEALVANLHAAMSGVGATVTSLVANADQTLTGALNSAVAVNDNVWDGLIDAARGSAVLVTLLRGLRSASSGGLSDLSATVGSAGDAVTLTTGELTNLLTSTVTGSLATALQAVVRTLNDPLALSSYIALAAAPLGIAGLALENGIDAVRSLATNGVDLVDTVVHGVTAQIDNALTLVNSVIASGRGLTDVFIIDGVLTAVQGIVSAPVSAVLAGVNGLSTTLANGATFTVDKLADGAGSLVRTWLGSGTDPGALQNAANAIGAGPLSPAAYTKAISILVGAGINSVQTVVGTASKFVSVPFRVGAGLTNTTANVITEFTSGLATAASGVLQAVGLPSFVYGLPHAVATAVNLAVQVAAKTTAAALNTVAGLLDVGTSIGSRLSLPGSATTDTARTALSQATSTPTALGEATSVTLTAVSAAGNAARSDRPELLAVTEAQSPQSGTQAPAETPTQAQTPENPATPAVPASETGEIVTAVENELPQAADSGAGTAAALPTPAAVADDTVGTEAAATTEATAHSPAEAATHSPADDASEAVSAPAQEAGAASKPHAADAKDTEGKPKHAAAEDDPKAPATSGNATSKPRHAAPDDGAASTATSSSTTSPSGTKPRHAAPERSGAATSANDSSTSSSSGTKADSAKQASAAAS